MRFHSRLDVWFLAIAGIPALLRAQSPPPPDLGAAASFAVLGSSVTSSGSTIITGNLGVSPGNTITGSPTVKIGAIYRNDSVARQAQKDAATAYNDLAGRKCDRDLSGQNLGGMTLGPGVFCFSSSAQLSGTLMLDTPTDSNAVWVFQIAGTLTADADSSVLIVNGHENNVFWQVGDSVTLDPRTAFIGNVLAHKDITLNSGSSVSGRLLAAGAVTLHDNKASLCCGLITLAPATLPNGTTGTAYVSTAITASGGIAPYTYAALPGSLPPGLTLSLAGVLSGTPTIAGSYTATITANDSTGVCSGNQVYKINISCPAITISPSILPNGEVCKPYNQTITPSCGTAPYLCGVASGGLPPGLVLSSCVISGTPTVAGVFSFTITATDSVSSFTTQPYTIVITCPIIPISPPVLPPATACLNYCVKLKPSCAIGSTQFSVTSGALPPGLPLSPDGMLCGTPSTAGIYSWTVTFTDSVSGCTGSVTYTLVVTGTTITPATLPDPVVGILYNETITASSGIAPYMLTEFGPLPIGLVFTQTTLTTATISGIATTQGCRTFTVTAKDANGCSFSVVYTICPNCPITIAPSALPNGSVCAAYSQTITANCAIAPYACSLTGILPSGLSFTSCKISGTPTTAGTSMFTVTVTDAAARSASQNYSLLVSGGVVLSPPTLPSATPGDPYNEVITASGGTAPYMFIITGPLPPGLFPTITSTTLTISGIPTTVGCFPFTVTATDANGCSTSINYTICVAVGGPTLSGWGMILLSILLVGVGFAVMRRGGLE